MIDAQTILIIVIVTLSFVLFFVGVQVVLVILEIRKALRKLDSILEDSIMGGGLIKPHKLTGIVELFKKGKMESHGEREF